MGLLELIGLLLIVGIVLALVPIDATIRNVILCLILIAVVLALFHGFGAFTGWRRNW